MLVVCHHRTKYWSEKVLHCSYLYGESFLDDELESGHKYFSLSGCHVLELVGEGRVQS